MFQAIQNFFIQLANLIFSVFPDCPFESYINATTDIEVLQYLNWFIPISDFIAIGQAWLVAIGIFYAYQVFARWAKVIAD